MVTNNRSPCVMLPPAPLPNCLSSRNRTGYVVDLIDYYYSTLVLLYP